MLLVLLGAALHAGWNTLVKAGRDKFLDTVLVATGSGGIAALALPFLPVPAMASWPYLVASGAIHTVYFLLVAAAYRTGDMGIAYPLMRGSAPLLVALSSGLLLGEHLTAAAWAGVLLISAGVLGLSLSWRGAAAAVRSPQAAASVGFALCNAGVIASYTLVDGTGARLSGHAAAYTLWVLVLTAAPLLAFACARRGVAVVVHLRARWRIGLVGGAATLASYTLALWAMTQAPIASVAALRETSILFAMGLSALVLREQVGWTRHAAAGAIVLGAVALRLA
jgi:drug/metabolite transporter (DMT)-like permease